MTAPVASKYDLIYWSPLVRPQGLAFARHLSELERARTEIGPIDSSSMKRALDRGKFAAEPLPRADSLHQHSRDTVKRLQHFAAHGRDSIDPLLVNVNQIKSLLDQSHRATRPLISQTVNQKHRILLNDHRLQANSAQLRNITQNLHQAEMQAEASGRAQLSQKCQSSVKRVADNIRLYRRILRSETNRDRKEAIELTKLIREYANLSQKLTALQRRARNEADNFADTLNSLTAQIKEKKRRLFEKGLDIHVQGQHYFQESALAQLRQERVHEEVDDDLDFERMKAEEQRLAAEDIHRLYRRQAALLNERALLMQHRQLGEPFNFFFSSINDIIANDELRKANCELNAAFMEERKLTNQLQSVATSTKLKH